MDLSIKPLTHSSLGLTESGGFDGYVELDSQIKAARTRVLFEYVTMLVQSSFKKSLFVHIFMHVLLVEKRWRT